MSSPPRPDPVRATLVAVLQQLNRVESLHEGQQLEQTLELDDLERMLHRFWAVENEGVKLPMMLGLLVRNGLVEGLRPAATPRGRVRYHITSEGKRFLVETMQRSDRIS